MANPNAKWEGEEGGLDNYELTIRNAKFGHVERDRGERVRLILHGEAKTEEGKLIDWAPDYPTGSAGEWEMKPDGSEVMHSSGNPDKWFHKRSGIIQLIKAMRKVGAPIEQRDADSNGVINPKTAALYNGLRFKMERTEVSRFTPEGESEEVVVSYDLPVEYLGEVDVSSSPSPSQSASAGTSTATSGAATTNGGGAIDDDMLKLIATNSDSFYNFIEKATGMGANISDPRLKEKTGIWAEVKG